MKFHVNSSSRSNGCVTAAVLHSARVMIPFHMSLSLLFLQPPGVTRFIINT